MKYDATFRRLAEVQTDRVRDLINQPSRRARQAIRTARQEAAPASVIVDGPMRHSLRGAVN